MTLRQCLQPGPALLPWHTSPGLLRCVPTRWAYAGAGAFPGTLSWPEAVWPSPPRPMGCDWPPARGGGAQYLNQVQRWSPHCAGGIPNCSVAFCSCALAAQHRLAQQLPVSSLQHMHQHCKSSCMKAGVLFRQGLAGPAQGQRDCSSILDGTGGGLCGCPCLKSTRINQRPPFTSKVSNEQRLCSSWRCLCCAMHTRKEPLGQEVPHSLGTPASIGWLRPQGVPGLLRPAGTALWHCPLALPFGTADRPRQNERGGRWGAQEEIHALERRVSGTGLSW